jgi:hypothetical protein
MNAENQNSPAPRSEKKISIALVLAVMGVHFLVCIGLLFLAISSSFSPTGEVFELLLWIFNPLGWVISLITNVSIPFALACIVGSGLLYGLAFARLFPPSKVSQHK